jgi:glucan phosphoethanolaminetransferase (alkaline phosphatase superfamily)
MRAPLPFTILNGFGFLAFAFFAWVQRNDIDPEIYYHPSSLDATLWLLFYALIAVLFVVVLFKSFPKWILIVAALACFIEMGRTAPGIWENFFGDRPFTMMQTSMSGDDPRVELSREFFGALIALGAVALLWWERAKFSRPPEPAPDAHS